MIELKQALADAKRNERHNNVAETRYWLNQYKLIAEQVIAELESQEPVAWIDRDGYLYKKPPKDLDERHPPYTPLYTHSPQRTWAGLTDDEMQAVIDAQPLVSNINVYFKAIEAKLKEKNNA
jgi:hypothetical protein